MDDTERCTRGDLELVVGLKGAVEGKGSRMEVSCQSEIKTTVPLPKQMAA